MVTVDPDTATPSPDTLAEDPDSFKSEPPTDNNQTANQNDDNKSMVDRLVEGRLFKEHDVEIKNLKTEDNGETATVTATIQNNKKNMTKDIKVLMNIMTQNLILQKIKQRIYIL